MDSRLPGICYVRVPGNAPAQAIVLVKKGESGYRPSRVQVPDTLTDEQITNLVNELNADLGITPQQSECMLVGSMFGWDVPGAQLPD